MKNKRTIKKALCFMMSVLMVLSCWVFTPIAQKASAAAGSYTYRIEIDVPNSYDISKNAADDYYYIKYYSDNGTGKSTTITKTTFPNNVGNEGNDQYFPSKDGASISGFPYYLNVHTKKTSNGWFWNTDGQFKAYLQIKDSSGNWKEICSFTSNKGSGEVAIYGEASAAAGKYPYASSITWNTSPGNIICAKSDSVEGTTTTAKASAKDQYGITMFDPTWAVKGDNKSTGLSVSPSSGASTTISAGYSANIDGDTNSQTGTVTATWNTSRSSTTSKSDKKTFTINDAQYTPKFQYFKGGENLNGTKDTAISGSKTYYGCVPTIPDAAKKAPIYYDNTYHYTYKSYPVDKMTADTIYVATYDKAEHGKHNYQTQTEPVTATTAGYIKHYCSCGDTYYTDIVAPTGTTCNGTVTSQEVYFNVPETIYLAPGSTSFQYALDQTMASNGTISVNSTNKTISPSDGANIDFYYARANNVKITASGVSSMTVGGTNVASTPLTLNLSSSKASAKLTAGTASANSSGYIKWTATYTDTTDKLTKTVTAYTYVYAPLAGASSTAAALGASVFTPSDTYYPHYTATYWLTGGHSVSNRTGDTYSFSGNYGHVESSIGSMYDPPLTDSTVTVGGGSSENKDKTTAYPAAVIPGSGMTLARLYGQNLAGVSEEPLKVYGGTLNLNVDTSRITDYSQVPNLKVGYDINYTAHIKAFKNRSIQTTTAGGAYTTTADSAQDPRIVNQQLSGAVTPGVTTLKAKDTGYYSDNDVQLELYTYLNTITSNKSALRTAVYNAQNLMAKYCANGDSSHIYSDVVWKAFTSAYENAYKNLTRVDEAVKADLVTALNDAVNEVNNAQHSHVLYDVAATESDRAGQKCYYCTAYSSIIPADVKSASCSGTTMTVTTNATCTGAGVTHIKCSCGYEYDDKTNPAALGHSFTNYVSDGNATCLADGTKTAKCDRCDETKTIADTGSQLAHSYTGDVQANGDGTHSFKCVNGCNEFGGKENCYGGTATCLDKAHCDVCGEEYGNPLGHSFTSGIYHNNENGTDSQKCIRCDVYGEEGVHSYGEAVWTWTDDFKATATFECKKCNSLETVNATVSSVDKLNPTCTETGERVYTASVTFGGVDYTDTKVGEIPKLAHTPVTDPAVAPTCTETGFTEGSHCSVCGAVIVAQEVVHAINHKNATTANGITTCPDCGKYFIEENDTTKEIADNTTGTPQKQTASTTTGTVALEGTGFVSVSANENEISKDVKSATGSFGTLTIAENGTASYKVTSMKFSGVDTFYVVKEENGNYTREKIEIVPSSRLMFEETFEQDTDNGITYTNSKNIASGYGEWVPDEDGHHSGGNTMKVSVSELNKGDWPKMNFSFSGTGFELIGATGNDCGLMLITVKQGDDTVKTILLDTYYGHAFTQLYYNTQTKKIVTTEPKEEEKETIKQLYFANDTTAAENVIKGKYTTEPNKNPAIEWMIDESSSNTMYQVPVTTVDLKDYGDYSVEIQPRFISGFGHYNTDGAGKKYYNVYIDGIRVINPADNANDTKPTTFDSTKYVAVKELMTGTDKVIGSVSGNAASMFQDTKGVDSSRLTEILKTSSNSNLYLQPGQAVAFRKNGSYTYQIGYRAVTGAGVAVGIGQAASVEDIPNATLTGGDTSSEASEKLISLNAYGNDNNVVVIKNTGKSIVALTNIVATPAVTPDPAANAPARAKARAMAAPANDAMVTVSEDTLDVAKALLEIMNADLSVNDTQITADKDGKITITAATSTDVESLVITDKNGNSVDLSAISGEEDNGTLKWTAVINVKVDGDYSFVIKAQHSTGYTSPDGASVSVTVKLEKDEPIDTPDEPNDEPNNSFFNIILRIIEFIKNIFSKIFG